MPAPQFPGLNVQELVDFRIQCPWKNEMRCARLFWEADAAEVITASRLTDERPDGFPASLAANRRARTVIGTSGFPVGGPWVVSWDGIGEVGVTINGANTRSTSNQFAFTRTTTGDTSIQVTIYSTNPGNPVRNLWIGEQQYFATRNDLRLKQQWRDHVVNAGVRCIRFMQWQHTGSTGNTVTHWGAGAGGTKAPHAAGEAEYFTDSGYIQGTPGNPDEDQGNGATYSSILNAAIELGARDIILAVPHAADDDPGADVVDQGATVGFVEQLVRFAVSHRHPFLNVGYAGTLGLAYSNETWNTAPATAEGNAYCIARGIALGLDGVTDTDKGNSFYALRSKQIFDTALAAASRWGFTGGIRRYLEGQATAGEYHFRFRSQIGAMQASPTNVEADFWSVASYYGHSEYEAGSPTPRIRLGGAHNPWLTPAAFTALTDVQLEQQLRNDLDVRVFAAVSTINLPGTFPSAPTIREGGFAADVLFAGDRGMQVVCYEGGIDHITIPTGATWDAASARSEAWHLTPNCAVISFEAHERHVAAGGKGTYDFDEGTAWSGRIGCWSWYQDHRAGYSLQPHYAAALLHNLQGATNFAVVVQDPATVVSRGAPITPSLSAVDLSATVASSTIVASATAITPALSIDLVQVASATFYASATAITPNLTQPIPIEAEVADATFFAHASAITPALVAPLSAEVAGARVFCCGDPIQPILTVFDTQASLHSSTTHTRALGVTAVLAGANGTVTRNKVWQYAQNIRQTRSAEVVPHGTTVYIGQLLGWHEGRVRPWRSGDIFAGISTEHERGTITNPEGVEVLRAYDYAVNYITEGAVWWPMDRAGIVGDVVYVRNDGDFTLTPNGDDVGKIIATRRGGGRALVHFEGLRP